MKEQIKNALGVIIPQMVRWAERMIGLLFDKDPVDKPSISFSKNGDAAFVHVTRQRTRRSFSSSRPAPVSGKSDRAQL